LRIHFKHAISHEEKGRKGHETRRGGKIFKKCFVAGGKGKRYR